MLDYFDIYPIFKWESYLTYIGQAVDEWKKAAKFEHLPITIDPTKIPITITPRWVVLSGREIISANHIQEGDTWNNGDIVTPYGMRRELLDMPVVIPLAVITSESREVQQYYCLTPEHADRNNVWLLTLPTKGATQKTLEEVAADYNKEFFTPDGYRVAAKFFKDQLLYNPELPRISITSELLDSTFGRLSPKAACVKLCNDILVMTKDTIIYRPDRLMLPVSSINIELSNLCLPAKTLYKKLARAGVLEPTGSGDHTKVISEKGKKIRVLPIVKSAYEQVLGVSIEKAIENAESMIEVAR